MSSFSISPAGLALIQQCEGFRAEPAQLPDGNWVVGFGHVRAGEAGASVTREEAADLLSLDVAPYENLVNGAVTATITQAQFDALVSFALSVGDAAFMRCDVLRRVNAGQSVAAACAMDAWRKSDIAGEMETIDALVRRRAAEKALFLSDAQIESTPSAFVRAKIDHSAAILGAPVSYAAAPEVGTILAPAPKPESGARLTEILMSEPATEALLLTQVVSDDEYELEPVVTGTEIVTAHAKPVPRSLSTALAQARIAARGAADTMRAKRVRFTMPIGRSLENLGLVALFGFGAVLVALGVAMLTGGRGDLIDFMGAGALMAPGAAAMGVAGFGLWKTPSPVSA